MISRGPSELIQKYRKKGLLVDSNLLLLFLIGDFNPALIASYKRTKGFTIEDFECLRNIMVQFDRIITTPNILTEISNLTKLHDKLQTDFFHRFGIQILRWKEVFIPSEEFCSETYFKKFGLTDAAIIKSATGDYLVITADLPLSNYLHKHGVEAINFNELRANYWS